jgi:Tfp pilus assembly protein PilF
MRSEIYLEQEKVEQARADIDEALLVEPNLVQGILMRSLVAAQEKRYSDAIADMRKLVRAQPDNPAWMLQLASYYQLDNRPRMSIKVADEVIKKDEKNWRAHRLRGDALLSVGDHKLAVGDYEKAITLLDAFKSEQAAQKDQNKPEAGKDETKAEEPKEDEKEEPAKDEGDEAAAAEDDNADLAGILNNLAWVLATSPKDDIRNGKRSLELGLRACELTKYKEAHILSTLAAGYAESGDMANAVKWSEKAVEAGKEEKAEQLEQLEKELESYKAGKPWREEQKQQENEVPVGSADRGIDS